MAEASVSRRASSARNAFAGFAKAVAGTALLIAVAAAAVMVFTSPEGAGFAPFFFIVALLGSMIGVAGAGLVIGLPLTWVLASNQLEGPWTYPPVGFLVGATLVLILLQSGFRLGAPRGHPDVRAPDPRRRPPRRYLRRPVVVLPSAACSGFVKLDRMLRSGRTMGRGGSAVVDRQVQSGQDPSALGGFVLAVLGTGLLAAMVEIALILDDYRGPARTLPDIPFGLLR